MTEIRYSKQFWQDYEKWEENQKPKNFFQKLKNLLKRGEKQ